MLRRVTFLAFLLFVCNCALAAQWYQGGTLHDKSALDWQQANHANKLATAGDFIAVMWKKDNLIPRISRQLHGVNDIRPFAEELVRQMDDATKPDGNPQTNRKMFANLGVGEIAVMTMMLMGWLSA